MAMKRASQEVWTKGRFIFAHFLLFVVHKHRFFCQRRERERKWSLKERSLAHQKAFIGDITKLGFNLCRPAFSLRMLNKDFHYLQRQSFGRASLPPFPRRLRYCPGGVGMQCRRLQDMHGLSRGRGMGDVSPFLNSGEIKPFSSTPPRPHPSLRGISPPLPSFPRGSPSFPSRLRTSLPRVKMADDEGPNYESFMVRQVKAFGDVRGGVGLFYDNRSLVMI